MLEGGCLKQYDRSVLTHSGNIDRNLYGLTSSYTHECTFCVYTATLTLFTEYLHMRHWWSKIRNIYFGGMAHCRKAVAAARAESSVEAFKFCNTEALCCLSTTHSVIKLCTFQNLHQTGGVFHILQNVCSPLVSEYIVPSREGGVDIMGKCQYQELKILITSMGRVRWG